MFPSGMQPPTHCMQSSLSLSLALSLHAVSHALSISPSLCANGVRVLGNFVARDKRRGAASYGIRHPPYHPDDPECQLPSRALQGAACHSGCGSCVSGIEEPGATSLPLKEPKAPCYSSLLDNSGTTRNTLLTHSEATYKCCEGKKKKTFAALPNMGRLHQQV